VIKPSRCLMSMDYTVCMQWELNLGIESKSIALTTDPNLCITVL